MAIIKKNQRDKKDREEAKKKGIKGGQVDQAEQERRASESIQVRCRGIIARKIVQQMREEEMVFLGMQRAPKTKEEIENDPMKLREKTMAKARQRQTENQNNYMKQKDDIKEEIKAVEGYDIKERMLKERRDWILE